MKRASIVFLFAAIAAAASPLSQAREGREGNYPVQVQVEACFDHAAGTACEYYEQLKKQVVLVTGECITPQAPSGTRPPEFLYCEPYPGVMSN
jgi:hypothetical protein